MNRDAEKETWDFADYAYTFTGVLVGFLLVGLELISEFFGVSILGGPLNEVLVGERFTFAEFRALSPLLFLMTTVIVFAKETIDVRKSGSYTGAMFKHTFESLLEETIYMSVLTFMIFYGIITNGMYASWLASPVTWVLFVFLFPLLKQKEERKALVVPWGMLGILMGGVLFEIVLGGWLFMPLSWLVICLIKLKDEVKVKEKSLDRSFNLIYYVLSVTFMGLGIGFDFWITSWTAFPVALVICWVMFKMGIYGTVKEVGVS